MNIGQMLRSVLGDMKLTDAKSLELKVGQIVRGVVLQLMERQDALVNIGNSIVRAHLEIPLKQGEATMLQVQPESSQGQVVLKPLQTSSVTIAQDSLADVLQNLGVKDQPSNRQLVQFMHQGGIPLTKENAEQLARVLDAMPARTDVEEWHQATTLAFQKGLPLTAETVGALRQTLHGGAMMQLADLLGRQIDDALNAAPATALKTTLLNVQSVLRAVSEMTGEVIRESVISPPAVSADRGVSQQVMPPSVPFNIVDEVPSSRAEAPALPNMRTLDSSSQAEQSNHTAGSREEAPPAALNRIPVGNSANGAGPLVSLSTLENLSEPPGAASGVNQSGESAPAPQQASSASTLPAASPEASASKSTFAVEPQPNPPLSPSVANPQPAAHEPTMTTSAESLTPKADDKELGNSVKNVQAPAGREGASAATETSPNAQNRIISRLLHAIGLDHENKLSRLPAHPENAVMPFPDTDGNGVNDANGKTDLQQTLKSVLLGLTGNDDVPAPIKDTAQQIVQQITGQQLLLTPDRAALFSHITMFVPFTDGKGNQTASVHVQSRKGPKGELDTDNCRLWFDLRMKALGNTLADVQVVDRIVSLHIHNDHPFIGVMLESHREEIAAALQQIGYKFISLKSSAYPQGSTAVEPSRSLDTTKASDPRLLYKTRPYRGVDVRV